jgi:hypothetical protein
MRSRGGQGRRDDPPRAGLRVLGPPPPHGRSSPRHTGRPSWRRSTSRFSAAEPSTFHPLTPEAHDWVAEHLPADALHLGDAVAVEWRYLRNVVGGAVADGLRVR